MYTPVKFGGLGFTPQYISLVVALAGVSQAVWMLGPFPPLQKRLGTGNVLRLCAVAWPFAFASLPLANELLRSDFKVAFWIVLSTGTVVGSGVSMAFGMFADTD